LPFRYAPAGASLANGIEASELHEPVPTLYFRTSEIRVPLDTPPMTYMSSPFCANAYRTSVTGYGAAGVHSPGGGGGGGGGGGPFGV
jgi:hypothetical protein